MLSHTVAIQYDATAFHIKSNQSYSYSNIAIADLYYTTLKDLVKEYQDIKKQISNSIEQQFIKTFQDLQATTKDVFVRFETFEIIYDSRKDKELPKE